MSQWTDKDYLTKQQYVDPSNLNARIRLHQLYSTNPQELQHWMFDKMLENTPEQARILVLGGGTGLFWQKNAERISAGWEITVSDLSQGMLDDAQKNLKDIVGNFDFRVIDAQEIPFGDNTFDIVTAHFMLYHVPDRVRAIAEIRRVLKPDGYLHAVTLGENHLRELYELAHEIIPERILPRNTASNAFRLENGAEQILGSFGKVSLARHDCDLKVTELQPLVDYALSLDSIEADDKRLGTFKNTLRQIFGRDGSIHISKDAGLFIANGYAKE
jgi:ubiquinone/menaquinone biosynthesis C-methylase UbiE